MIKDIIAKNIQSIVAERNITLTAIAKQTGLSITTVRTVFYGDNMVKLDTVERIASVLNCDIQDIITEHIDEINVMLDENAKMPNRAHKQDAGYDLFSPVKVIVYPKESVVIDTGVHIQIPNGYVGFLKSKSGLNVNYNLVGEGVIDSGYTGSIKVKIYNHGSEKYVIEEGNKIIQLVLLPIYTPKLKSVKQLENTDRGAGGFGSTGK